VAVEDAAPKALAFAIEGRNPAAGRASFRLALPAAATVDVGVFDILGRRVATVAQGELSAGEHVMHWDPAANGGAARAGVYLARMRAGEKVMTQRFVLLR
jgi:flagellar hook assembly protein FlgD